VADQYAGRQQHYWRHHSAKTIPSRKPRLATWKSRGHPQVSRPCFHLSPHCARPPTQPAADPSARRMLLLERVTASCNVVHLPQRDSRESIWVPVMLPPFATTTVQTTLVLQCRNLFLDRPVPMSGKTSAMAYGHTTSSLSQLVCPTTRSQGARDNFDA
jgi:hypothetical protein